MTFRVYRMRLFLRTMSKALVGVLLPISIAAAQVAPSLSQPWSGLNRDDLDRMHAAAARLYEGRSVGTVERWRNPDNNDAGTTTLLRQFEAKAMPCSRIEYKVRLAETGESRQYVLD